MIGHRASTSSKPFRAPLFAKTLRPQHQPFVLQPSCAQPRVNNAERRFWIFAGRRFGQLGSFALVVRSAMV
jgi:hypothetical protein